MSGSPRGLRASTVHGIHLGVFAVLASLLFLVPAFDAAAADLGSVGRQERLQAEGWLQLKQDQKTYRESVEPLAPGKASRLDQLERSQKGRARGLEQRQRQSLNRERNRWRGVGAERPVARPREFESQRQFDRQRLEMRIQRETLRPGFR